MGSATMDPVEIGKRYDESSPVSGTFNAGQAHLAYWYGAHDDTTMVDAARRLTRKVADALGLRAGEHLLDAGCGPGAPALQIAEETGARVTGISVSAFEVTEAGKRAAAHGLGDRVRFEYGDWMALSYPDGTFDAVMAVETLQCAPDLGVALDEFHRVLRPGGRITVADYSSEDRMTDDEAEEFSATFGINKPPRLAGWIAALSGAGFVVEEYTQCGRRVFGMTAKYLDSAEGARDALVAKFGEDVMPGLRDGLAHFFAVGPERLGYAIVSARKPG